MEITVHGRGSPVEARGPCRRVQWEPRRRRGFVYSEEHVRGHVLLCLPAWYLEWHLHRRLAPLLFEDEAPAVRDSPVQKAQRSQQANAKTATRTTP